MQVQAVLENKWKSGLHCKYIWTRTECECLP